MGRTVESWSRGEAARLAGVNFWTLRSWDRRGFLAASETHGDGHGSRHRFSFTDLVAIRAAARLRANGATPARILRALRFLGAADTKSGLLEHGAHLVCIDDDVQLILDPNTLLSLLKVPGQLGVRSILVVDLEREVSELRQQIAQLDATPRKARAKAPAKGKAA